MVAVESFTGTTRDRLMKIVKTARHAFARAELAPPRGKAFIILDDVAKVLEEDAALRRAIEDNSGALSALLEAKTATTPPIRFQGTKQDIRAQIEQRFPGVYDPDGGYAFYSESDGADVLLMAWKISEHQDIQEQLEMNEVFWREYVGPERMRLARYFEFRPMD